MYSVVLVMALAGSADAPDCHRHSCHGGRGCQGGYTCHGGGYGGCYGGGYGGCYGGVSYGGCYGGGYGGCYGGGYGGGYYGSPKWMPPPEKIGEPKDKDKKEQVTVPTPATIVVSLPANAKLTIDGYVSKQTSSERRLVTVPIAPDREFTYTLVAEVNGTQQAQTVTVRAGQTMPVNFNFSTQPTTASR